MLIYLDHALAAERARCQREGRALTPADLRRAIIEGAVERVCPR
jgi:Cu(I)/Ag(I) efflux system membrane protein CusA/SilA